MSTGTRTAFASTDLGAAGEVHNVATATATQTLCPTTGPGGVAGGVLAGVVGRVVVGGVEGVVVVGRDVAEVVGVAVAVGSGPAVPVDADEAHDDATRPNAASKAGRARNGVQR